MDFSEDVFDRYEKTQLFDKKSYSKIERNEHESLRLMGNCVALANATILRERKLIPEEYFIEYPVYGNVTGYMVEEKTAAGKKLAAKLNVCRESIQLKLLEKLAIVVEDEINCGSREMFLWNFEYDVQSTNASAVIGFRGEKSKFTVNYNNMEDTCRQFCNLFNKLQDILEQLKPLPIGMVPSIKVAYRGEPEFVHGFYSVDEFVNLRGQVPMDGVAFPSNNKFQFSYASDFAKELNQRQDSVENHSVMSQLSDLQIEAPRQDTMNQEIFDISYDEPVDRQSDSSLDCNPNNTTKSDERKVLQSEYASERRISHHEDVHQENNIESEKLEARATKESEKLQKDDPDKLKVTRKRKEKEVPHDKTQDESKIQKKKCTRRLTSTVSFKDNVENLEEDRRSTVPMDVAENSDEDSRDKHSARTSQIRKRKLRSSRTMKTVASEADELVAQANQLEITDSGKVVRSQRSPSYGRVRSLSTLGQKISENAQEEFGKALTNTQEISQNSIKYAKTFNIVEAKETGEPTLDKKRDDQSNNFESFARVSSLLALANRVIPAQSPPSQIISPIIPESSTARVPSLLALAETSKNQKDQANVAVESDKITFNKERPNKYARVRSLKDGAVQQSKKYGHSSSLRLDKN